MPTFCSECGPVDPREHAGTADLRCPRCGRTLMQAPAPRPYPHAGPYAPQPYAGAPYQGAPYPAAVAAAPYAEGWQGTQEGWAAAQQYAALPEYYAQRYDGEVVARRWLSTIVDHVILVVFAFGALVAAELLLGEEMYATALPVTTVAVLIPILAYFPWLEGRYGATPGKRAAGLRVVDREGNPPGLAKGCIRTLLRVLEVNPVLLGGVIAGICVLVTRNRQRLGDLAAGTYVLLKEDADAVLRARNAPRW